MYEPFYKFRNGKWQCQVAGLSQIYQGVFGNIADGTFVEVGAFNGEWWSNTNGLADVGWRGVMAEPNPKLFQECAVRHGHNNVAVFNVAVGNHTGKSRLYLSPGKESIATTNRSWAERKSVLSVESFIECDMITMDALLRQGDVRPQFEVCVIDTEGTEPDVLSSFDITYWKPALCIVEVHEQLNHSVKSENTDWINAYFDKFGYQKVYSDLVNNIYISDKSWRRRHD